jgi:hypothetical protein
VDFALVDDQVDPTKNRGPFGFGVKITQFEQWF